MDFVSSDILVANFAYQIHLAVLHYGRVLVNPVPYFLVSSLGRVVASLPGGVRLVTWTILAVINWMCFGCHSRGVSIGCIPGAILAVINWMCFDCKNNVREK